MTRERRQYDFGTKLEIVLRHVEGESGGLSPRNTGSHHPAPSPTGRVSIDARVKTGCDPRGAVGPPTDRGNPPPENEIETLRKENERLRAEVAYLGKLRALRSQERR